MPTKKARPALTAVGPAVDPVVGPALPAPELSATMTALNSDASSVVLSFLLSTPSSAHTISKLNRAFRAYVFSAFAGPLSLKSFDAIERVQPFSSVKVLDARSCAWLDDAGMKALACTTLLPALQAVDFSESPKVSSAGVKALLKARGATLKSFTQKAYSCANMKVTVSTIKALKTVTSLEFCSLTLGSGFKCGLEALSDHPTLRRLSIHFEGFTHNNLPSNLPCLEELCIETGSWANFIWPQGVHGVGHFEACSYPNCTKVVINDQVGVSMDKPPLTSRLIIALASHFGKGDCSISVTRVGGKADSFWGVSDIPSDDRGFPLGGAATFTAQTPPLL